MGANWQKEEKSWKRITINWGIEPHEVVRDISDRVTNEVMSRQFNNQVTRYAQ